MVINQDHYINDVLHESGDHALTMERYGTPYVCVGVRILVDPNNPDDLATVHRLQDRIGVRTGSSQPFVLPDYEPDSFTATRQALLELAKGIGRFDRAFGARAEVDPVRHLVGTAAGWGGLPQEEAFYVNVNPALPVGAYDLTVGAVPVDAFWSISVYNEGGFFEANAANAQQRQQHLRCPQRRRHHHRAVRRRSGGAELPADHGRLELPGPPVPAAPGDS